MTDRKAVALALKEAGTDFALLKRWSDIRLETALVDFCQINPNDHGALAAAQGHIREAMNLRKLEAIVTQAAAQPD